MKQITESEMIIMQIIWDAEGTVTSNYVQEKLPEEVTWKMTTITTFLSRLAGKDMINVVDRNGRTNYYVPTMSEKEYRLKTTLKTLKGPSLTSIKNLIASLYETNDISKKNIAALKQWLQEDGYDSDRH
jgi:BlaI family penicillinase repressor